VIAGSVVHPPVVVAPTAVIENCILGPHVSIGSGARLKNAGVRDSIVNENAVVEDIDRPLGDEEEAVVRGHWMVLNVGFEQSISGNWPAASRLDRRRSPGGTPHVTRNTPYEHTRRADSCPSPVSRSVTEGPQQIADQISDAVLDALIAQDKMSRVACEVLVTTGLAFVAGEITSRGYVEIPSLVRRVIGEIGYDSAEFGFDSHTCAVITAIDDQSPDIAMGVDKGGAGDQGLMFGFACRGSVRAAADHAGPQPRRQLAYGRRKGIVPYLPDGKSQVTVSTTAAPGGAHRGGIEPARRGISQSKIRRDIIKHVIEPVIPNGFEGGPPTTSTRPGRS
jgi:carbonic anhydrase/acetyltransferase-like protein (isoleucine patch superfamily)